MNKKGFTLVEVLAVAALIAIILALVLPTVTSILKQSEDTVYDVKINTILKSSYDYTIKDVEFLPEYEDTKYIMLAHLKENNLIDSDITDPISRELFIDNLVISIKNVGTNHKDKSKNSLVKGYYLYKIENDFMQSDEFMSNAPTIEFVGYDNTQVVLNINVGDEYTPVEYIATSSEGENITDKIIKIITYNKKKVNDVDTNKPGIYYISHSVIDDRGYSANEKVSIIISDTEKPNLTIPENITISKDVTKFNIMEGVFCEDNSGDCEISTDGKIDYGVLGKYVIEYSAKDPSGNTTTLKRVITVSE